MMTKTIPFINDNNSFLKTLKVAALTTTIAMGVAACASKSGEPMVEEQSAKAEMQTNSVAALYEVHHDGRIYMFYDRELYKDFVKTGHTAYMVARIAAGPNGETLKFALTGEDKKKREGIPSIDLYEGAVNAAEPFYGEMRAEGRIYVFDSYEDMKTVRKLGEAPLRFTQIGGGPKGETVIYVRNSSNKKEKPVALIEAFQKANGLI